MLTGNNHTEKEKRRKSREKLANQKEKDHLTSKGGITLERKKERMPESKGDETSSFTSFSQGCMSDALVKPMHPTDLVSSFPKWLMNQNRTW